MVLRVAPENRSRRSFSGEHVLRLIRTWTGLHRRAMETPAPDGPIISLSGVQSVPGQAAGVLKLFAFFCWAK